MSTYSKVKMSFPGGTHPPEKKELTSECKIKPVPPPRQVTIMLSQHIGAACKPLVEKGQEVTVGEKIGDSDAFVSAPVHSSVNGKVKEISLQPHVIMGRSPGIVIEADPENNSAGEFLSELQSDVNIDGYSAGQICEAVRQCGLVGMGGAGFPTRVKIEPNPQMPKETMIINGCECEPYITGDYRLMLERTHQVITGIKLAKKGSGCTEVFIAIEDNKPEAIKAVNEALETSSGCEGIKVVTVKTKYPQGGERQLINAVLNKTVPTGGIPPMIGVLVLNVATTAAIAEAIISGRPLTHRVVTVTGEAIARSGNYYTLIGMQVGELIEFCGGVTEKSAKVVLGGPMMGITIADLSTPVTKATGAITILTKKQIGKAKFQKRQTPCIRCGRCLEVCPENLNPTKIAYAVKCNDFDAAKSYYISACMECGCCSYVCPANIEITGYIKTGKILLARQKGRMPQ